MSALVLLNLLNSLPKTDKMLGKPRILSLIPNLFNTCVLDGTREARVVQWDAGSYIQDQISFSQFSNDLLYQ